MMLYFTRRDYNPFSWAVRTATGEAYSHVAVGFGGYIYEAVLGGVRAVPEANFKAANVIVRVAPVEHLQARSWFEASLRATSKIGKAYDIPALFWFLVLIVAARFGKQVPRLTINPRWLICSEYVWYVLTGETKTVTPREVLDFVTAPAMAKT